MFHLLGLGFGLWALFFLFRGLFWILVVGFIIWLIARGASQTAGPFPPRSYRSNGLDILEQRYARGEVTREEYLEKKRDLLAGHSL